MDQEETSYLADDLAHRLKQLRQKYGTEVFNESLKSL